GLLVEAGFLEQAPGGVVFEAGGAVVFVAQFQQLAEAVPAVVECCSVGVKTLLDQSGFVVVPGGALAQSVGVGEQAAFGVAGLTQAWALARSSQCRCRSVVKERGAGQRCTAP
ncbi:hypothetical protein, partial [Pseudomonas sp. RL_5y_Pfl2_73]|uniref:hypothetical protein n=2 Tax=unclassified Pseudomonas TaxID=196821 RepID=UPI00403EFA26